MQLEQPTGTIISNGGSKDFGSRTIGTSVTLTFTIRNLTASYLQLTGLPRVDITGANQEDFVVTASPSNTINPNSTTFFSVQFTPRGGGVRSATLTIVNTSNVTPYIITITGTGTGAPEISVEQPAGTIINSGGSKDFGSQTIGNSSSRQFTIRNTGDVTLSLNGTPKVAVTGHTEDFVVSTSPASSVAGNGSTPFTVVFTPRASGVRSATLSIANSDGDENPYIINITGTGTGAVEMDVEYPTGTVISSGGSVNLGTLALESSKSSTFTIRNTGDVTLSLNGTPKVDVTGHTEDFVVSTSPASTIPGGGTTFFTILWVPKASGVRSATLSIANDDSNENPYIINITGTATSVDPEIVIEQPAGTVVVSGSTKDFGTKTVNTTTIYEFKILNTGSGTLSLPGLPRVDVTGHTDDFLVYTYPSNTVTAGGYTAFTVHFTPRYNGTRSATLVIPTNDSDENPYVITLTGTGTGGIAIDTYVFNIQIASLPTVFNKVVTPPCPRVNAWAAPSTVDTIRTSPASYSVTLTPPAGQPAGVDIFTWNGDQIITYSASGPYTTSTSSAGENNDQTKTQIAYQGNPGTYTILINATNVDTPEIVVEYGQPAINYNSGDPKVDFGTQLIGTNTDRTFTIRNTGSATLIINSITVGGDSDFTITSSPANNVSVGGSTTFTVRFTPAFNEQRNATITISTNDDDEGNFNLGVTGTGEGSPISPTISIGRYDGGYVGPGSTQSFGSIALGSSTIVDFIIENVGDSALSLTDVTIVSIAGVNTPDFEVISFPSTTINPYFSTGDSTFFTIRFAPLALGTRTARIAIASNDPVTPIHIFNITGTATEGTPTPPSNVFSIDYATPGNKYRLIAGQQLVKLHESGAPFVILFSEANPGVPVSFAWDIIPSIDQDLATPPMSYTGSGYIIRILEAIPEQLINVNYYSGESPNWVAQYGVYTDSTCLISVGGAGFVSNEPQIIVQYDGVNLASGTTYNFGQVVPGTEVSRTFTIVNVGDVTLNLTSSPPIQINGDPDFIINTQPADSIIAASFTTFVISFVPIALGSRNATITINNNDSSNGTFTISLVGVSTNPSTTAPPDTLDDFITVLDEEGSITSDEDFDLYEARRIQESDAEELEQIRIKTNKVLVNTYKIERESVRNYGESLLQEDTARLKQELEEVLQSTNYNNNTIVDKEAILREIINKNRGLVGLPPVTQIPADVINKVIDNASYNEALASILTSTFLYHSSNNYNRRGVAF